MKIYIYTSLNNSKKLKIIKYYDNHMIYNTYIVLCYFLCFLIFTNKNTK